MCLVGIFQEGDAERDRGFLQQERADFGQQDAQAGQAQLVDLGRALVLAQADGEHLEQAALVLAGEGGVGLDAVQEDDAVGLEGVAVEVNGQAERVGAEHDGVHVGQDGAAHAVWAVTPNSARSASWPSAVPPAVAAHRGDDEGGEAQRAQGVDRRAGDTGDAGDASTADRERDRAAGGNALLMRLEAMAWATAAGTSATTRAGRAAGGPGPGAGSRRRQEWLLVVTAEEFLISALVMGEDRGGRP